MARKDPRPSEEHVLRNREIAALLIPALRECARRCGYALAVHGSLERDIDLIGVPWAPEFAVVEATSLAEKLFAVCEAVFGYCSWAGNWRPDANFEPPSGSLPNPERKPHGRLAWAIHIGITYIDLSVMPRLKEAAPEPKRSKARRKRSQRHLGG